MFGFPNPFLPWTSVPPDPSFAFRVGDRVEKASGYKWPGVVVSVFRTTKGEQRIVVECTIPEVAGALHIYNPSQLVKA